MYACMCVCVAFVPCPFRSNTVTEKETTGNAQRGHGTPSFKNMLRQVSLASPLLGIYAHNMCDSI